MNNIEKLIAAGEAAFGNQWQTDISRALGVNVRTVRSWLSGKYQMPSLIFADITKILEERKLLIDEVLKMTKETYLMNPVTGSVDTKENWLSEMPEWETNQDGLTAQQQFDTLIEVVKDKNGDWVEVE